MSLKNALFFKYLLGIRLIHLFLVVIALQYLFLFLNTNFILTDGNSYSSIGKMYSVNGVEKDEKSTISLIILNYLFPWIYFSIKFIAISLTLLAGFLVAGMKSIKLIQVFKITIIAELIFFIRSYYSLYHFGVVEENFKVEDYQSFTPFSVKNIFMDTVPEEFHYILSLLNVYELIYVIILCFLFCKTFPSIRIIKTISTVTLSYLTLIIFWSLFITLVNILHT